MRLQRVPPKRKMFGELAAVQFWTPRQTFVLEPSNVPRVQSERPEVESKSFEYRVWVVQPPPVVQAEVS